MENIYKRHEALYDLHDELKDAISDIKHLLSLGAVAEDHSLFSDLLDGYERMLERAGAELDEVSARIEAIERADFERMTA